MIYVLIASILALTGIGGYFNALMDLSSEGQKKAKFLWRPVKAKKDTWTDKWNVFYHKGDRHFTYENLRSWWYLGLWELPRDEKFPYSSTALVWLTDDWHLFKMLFLSCQNTIMIILLYTQIDWYALFGYIVIPFVRFLAFESKYKEKL